MGLLGFDEIKSRLERYCAFQERSPFEVKKKLNSFTSDSKQIDGIMASLIKEGFLNQERFVESYVQGKVNQKRWGKEKIKAGLIQHKTPPNLVVKSLKQINPEKYKDNLLLLAEKKCRGLSTELSVYEKKAKILRFLSSKGYTSDDCYNLDFDGLFTT